MLLWISVILLRFRGRVPSGLELDSGVLSTSSSFICSSFSCRRHMLTTHLTPGKLHFESIWNGNLCWSWLVFPSGCGGVWPGALCPAPLSLPLSLQEDGLPRCPVLQSEVAHSSAEVFCFGVSHHGFGVAQEQEESVESGQETKEKEQVNSVCRTLANALT